MIKGLSKVRPVVALTAIAASAAPAMAATDGLLGTSSGGTVAITASVPGRVKITKLTDIAFTDVDSSSSASRAQDVCVWSNTAGRKYTIMASGSGASDAFTLAAGPDTAAVPYTVEWGQTSGRTAGTALTAKGVLADQTSAALTQDCGGGTSASLIVGIAATDLQGMTASMAYTGTLTLLVSVQ